ARFCGGRRLRRGGGGHRRHGGSVGGALSAPAACNNFRSYPYRHNGGKSSMALPWTATSVNTSYSDRAVLSSDDLRSWADCRSRITSGDRLSTGTPIVRALHPWHLLRSPPLAPAEAPLPPYSPLRFLVRRGFFGAGLPAAPRSTLTSSSATAGRRSLRGQTK